MAQAFCCLLLACCYVSVGVLVPALDDLRHLQAGCIDGLVGWQKLMSSASACDLLLHREPSELHSLSYMARSR